MIPKKIHYCWFGRGQKPKLAEKCIESWKKFCPDYEIIEWNEDNFNVNTNPYTKMCYENKMYAFLSDYVRLVTVYEHGGIYFDSDVEAVKSFDDLLNKKGFYAFENNDYIASGLGFGSEAGNPALEAMIKKYDLVLDGKSGTIGCPRLNTQALTEYGFKMNGKMQEIDGVVLYPKEYFNPFDDNTGIMHKTDNTYSIHWYGKSWMNRRDIIRNRFTRVIHRFLGTDIRKNSK